MQLRFQAININKAVNEVALCYEKKYQAFYEIYHCVKKVSKLTADIYYDLGSYLQLEEKIITVEEPLEVVSFCGSKDTSVILQFELPDISDVFLSLPDLAPMKKSE